MALTLAGIPHEVVGISEVDKHALASYEAIYGDCPNLGDIRKIERLPECDLVTASFPCQSLSIAAKKRSGMVEDSGTESSLGWEAVRLIETAVKDGRPPEYIVWENVPLLLTNPEFPKLLDRLFLAGYRSKWAKLDSSRFGSAQKRVRAFIVSRYQAYPPDLPECVPDAPVLRLKDVMDDDRPEEYVRRIPLSHIMTRNGKDMRKDGIIVMADWQREGRLDLANRIYDENGLSPAMVCHGGGNREVKVSSPDAFDEGFDEGRLTVRAVTPKESWRLMGFPDWAYDRAEAVCSKTQLYNQAGNSIVVEVLMAIFRGMYTESRASQKTLENFFRHL